MTQQVSWGFCRVINASKGNLGKKGFISDHSPPLGEVRAGALRQELRQRSGRGVAYWLVFQACSACF